MKQTLHVLKGFMYFIYCSNSSKKKKIERNRAEGVKVLCGGAMLKWHSNDSVTSNYIFLVTFLVCGGMNGSFLLKRQFDGLEDGRRCV